MSYDLLSLLPTDLLEQIMIHDEAFNLFYVNKKFYGLYKQFQLETFSIFVGKRSETDELVNKIANSSVGETKLILHEWKNTKYLFASRVLEKIIRGIFISDNDEKIAELTKAKIRVHELPVVSSICKDIMTPKCVYFITSKIQDMFRISGKDINDIIAKIPKQNYDWEFVETRTITMTHDPTLSKNKIKFSDQSDARNNYGYANLKMEYEPGHVTEIFLQFTGNKYDHLYPKHMNRKIQFQMFDENILPAGMFTNYEVIASHNDKIKITYDVVKLKNFDFNNMSRYDDQKKFVFTYMKPINIINNVIIGKNKVELNVYQVSVNKLIISTEVKIIDLQIVINYCSEDLEVSFIPKKIDDYLYEFDLETILYVRSANIYLKFNSNEAGSIHVFGESKNIALMNAGMFGCMFSA